MSASGVTDLGSNPVSPVLGFASHTSILTLKLPVVSGEDFQLANILLLLLLRRMLDGDACCPREGGCPPQLLQVAIELVPQ